MLRTRENHRAVIQQDFVAYHQSLLDELRSVQNRVRNLIGQSHWLTDGEHKEAVIKNILRTRLPEVLHVGRGFVCFPAERDSSGQLDILITARNRPTLYRDGDLVFVTPNSVKAIAEVKTELRAVRGTSRQSLEYVLEHFANELEKVRRSASERCWAGLFVFESGSIDHENLLSTLQRITDGNEERAIDCISIGDNLFVHYWENGHQQVGGRINGPVWHSYEIAGLAPAYFISNMVLHLSPDIPEDEKLAWFPIEGGKETQRHGYATLNGNTVRRFAA